MLTLGVPISSIASSHCAYAPAGLGQVPGGSQPQWVSGRGPGLFLLPSIREESRADSCLRGQEEPAAVVTSNCCAGEGREDVVLHLSLLLMERERRNFSLTSPQPSQGEGHQMMSSHNNVAYWFSQKGRPISPGCQE